MKKRVLIVDDLQQNRYMLRVLLEGNGYDVLEAENGIDALESARRELPDVVVSDLLMPEMDGFSFCRAWMGDIRLSRVPFVVFSATYTHQKDRQLALDLGATEFIVKPAEPDDVVQAISRALCKAEQHESPRQSLRAGEFFERYSERLHDKLGQKIKQLASTEQTVVDYITRCEAILDVSPNAVISVDGELLIRSWNFAAERLLGYVESEMMGKSIALTVPPELRGEWERIVAVVLERREISEFETQRLRKDGSRVDVAVSLSFLGPGIGFVGVFSDLSAIRKAAEESRRMEAQMAQADRLASLGMLAAGIAHEINNPLSYVLDSLETLSTELPALLDSTYSPRKEPTGSLGAPTSGDLAGASLARTNTAARDDACERLREALVGTRRIREIARGLGTFSRVEDEPPSAVNLVAVIEVAINMALHEIRYRARLVKELGEVPAVLASDGRLLQVFLNLLLNASHSIDEGDVENNEIRVRTWIEAEQVCAEIRDTGGGIRPEHLDRVFEPFFTTKSVGSGSGLGLAISRSIIEGYGGQIRVHSEMGKGTSFVVRLPSRVQQTAPRAESLTPNRGTERRGRVLVVDDDPAVRAMMMRMLRGHDTIGAAGGAAAQAILEGEPSIDAIVCDVMMPEISGVELHRWVSKRLPKLARRFVFVSGGAFTVRVREYLAQAGNTLLDKPLDPARFRKVVADIIVSE